MADIIKAIVTGEINFDLEERKTQHGTAVTKVVLKSITRKGANATYIDCSAWGDLAHEVATTYHKGDKVLVMGRLSKYRKSNTDRTYLTEVAIDSIELLNAVSSAPPVADDGFSMVDDDRDESLPF